MVKTEKHYALWCIEKGLNPTKSENIIEFMKDDNVYYSDFGEIYIDTDNEMNYAFEIDGVDMYYHNSFELPEWAVDDDLVDIPLYYHLRNR